MAFRPNTLGVLSLVILTIIGNSQEQEFFRLTYNMTEEQEAGIFVGNTALDTGLYNSANSQDLQNLKFEIFEGGDENARFFTVDGENGVIRTKARIDREQVCGNNVDCTMLLNMAVYRKTSPSSEFNFFKSIQAAVRVEDKNDNAPEFPQNVVTLTMPENMGVPYRLYTSVATDRDKRGPNSNVTYSFESTYDVFDLEVPASDSGLTELVIRVDQVLDREVKDTYHVRVVAADKGSPRQSGSVLINIVVTDRNDNAPEFVSSNYSVNVNENASMQEPILTVSAVDRDANDNGEVWYKMGSRVDSEIRDHFRIGETDGKLYLTKSLNYEARKDFVFLIEAWDRGDPPQSSTAYIIVHIVDVNDNAPEIFLNLSPEGTDIMEHEPAGKFLGHISVTDRDSGVHGDVVCQINDSNFRLEPFNEQRSVYKIILSQPLDHEDSPRRQVAIFCRDGDRNPMLATETFEVEVLDINDNAPGFSSSTFTGYVLENEPRGTKVMTQMDTQASGSSDLMKISAVDLDDGESGRVTYSIPVSTNFSIDSLTGVLSSLTTFDREVRAQYTFPVVARDNGDEPMSSTATVVVNIIDQNDNPPHFDHPIFFLQIRENMVPGSACGRIQALDEDAGENAQMVYTIVRDDDSSRYFSVDRNTGDISTNQMFDRETRDSYSFTMEVQNPHMPLYKDSAQVLVSVMDDNDHVPVITNPPSANATITLPNNTTVGSLILRVRAEDGDDPKSTVFEYTIPGSDRGNLFQVITVTGELILARDIRPEDAKTHRLLLVVSDGGSNPQSATATLLIRIPSEGMKSTVTANIFREANFIIIVVIVVVTILVGLMVVTAICCIFRRDKKRRASRQPQRHVKDKMYQAAHWVSTHSLPPDDSSGSPAHEVLRGSEMLEKKGKKEVSFSLDDDPEKDGDGDPDTSGSQGSVFAHNPAAADNNNLKPLDGRFITFMSGKTSPASHATQSCYESSDSYTYQNTPIAETEDHLHLQLERCAGEDALSASSGETGTDSGRGGSEDEIHSNRGSAQETDSRVLQPASQLHNINNNNNNNSGYAPLAVTDRGRRKPSSLSSLPEEHHHLAPANDHALHPNPNHNYFRSSSEQLPSHGLGYPAGCSKTYAVNARDSSIRGRDGSTYYSLNRGGPDGPFRIRDATHQQQQQQHQQPPAGRKTFHTFGPQHQNQNTHPAWRRAKGLDGGWRSAGTPNTLYSTTDDDDLTTTSGSYTLNPDDSPSDIDEVSFHKAHDIMV